MKPMTTLPGMDQVASAGRAAADAARNYGHEPSDPGWFAYRAAVERVNQCMQTTIHDAPSTPAFDAMRDAAALMSEAGAIMRAAGGRLSPGAELAVVEQLIQASEQWAAAWDLRDAALDEFVRTHDPDRARDRCRQNRSQRKRRRP